MQKLVIAIFLAVFSNYKIISQDLAAFNDYQNHFTVFDKGETKSIENLPVKSYKIGGNAIAYVSSTSELKVYFNGRVKTLAETFSFDYFASKNLIVYQIYNQLYVFDNGDVTLLSGNAKLFSVTDNIISFYNQNTKSFHVYYEGKVWDIEDSYVGKSVKYYKTGNNTFAYYNDNSKHLKLFLNGEIKKIVQINGLINFKPGQNILAYIDIAMNSFHSYYNNKITDLEYFRPKLYDVGNNFIAYLDNLGEFKVFWNDEIISVSSFEPSMFKVKDNMLLFYDESYLKIFYQNKIYDVCDYIPNNYKMQESTFAYKDLNGKLNAFIKGELKTITYDNVKSFDLAYDIIIISTTGNKTQIFYKDKLYKF
ncbi:MAG: hypothetical protein JXR51_02815 [Bacteroidales bacterium]|nr:hypothetical protein [Bacteroidales bacterium]MBN2756081.1 hypothetical protein [Bacteroidales bacterium]